MKTTVLIIAVVLTLNINSYPQIIPFDLDGVYVTSIKLFDNVLYVGTIDSGVYSRAINDPQWMSLGLNGKKIKSIYFYPKSYSGYKLLAGIDI